MADYLAGLAIGRLLVLRGAWARRWKAVAKRERALVKMANAALGLNRVNLAAYARIVEERDRGQQRIGWLEGELAGLHCEHGIRIDVPCPEPLCDGADARAAVLPRREHK